MISFQQYLTEATFNLDSAVDYIYNRFYAGYFKKLSKLRGGDTIPPAPQTVMISSKTLAKESKNKAIAVASVIKPVDILIQGPNNAYSPTNTRVSVRLSQFVDFLLQHANQIKEAPKSFLAVDIVSKELEIFDKKQSITFRQDYAGEKMKNSIAHELSHYTNDVKNNNNIMTQLMKAKGKGSSIEALQGLHNVALTDIEVDAQIHQIKQMKRGINDVLWNALSFEDMLSRDNSLYRAIWQNLNFSDKKQWKKKILKRMARENLLGKRMGK